MAKKKLKKAIKAAGPNISKSEMKTITKAAGGNVAKAVTQISKAGANLNSGAANMVIKQAQKQPATPFAPQQTFGTSKLGQTLQSMAGTPGTPGALIKGQTVGGTAGTPGTGLMIGGTQIKPGGGVRVTKPEAPTVNKPTLTPSDPNGPGPWAPKEGDGTTTTTTTETVNPNQDIIDALTKELGGVKDTLASYQELSLQNEQAYQQQLADMSNMFNMQIAQQQQDAAYQQQLAAAQALQEQQAARAFMINQGRGGMPPNLQLGYGYGTPQLAGTQGFKRTPPMGMTPAQVATAFTAPTLAAGITPTLQPSVLNV